MRGKKEQKRVKPDVDEESKRGQRSEEMQAAIKLIKEAESDFKIAESLNIKAATKASEQHNLEGWIAPDDWKTDWNDHCARYGKEKTLQELLK